MASKESVRSKCRELVVKYPNCRNEVREIWDIMECEIEDGASEYNETECAMRDLEELVAREKSRDAQNVAMRSVCANGDNTTLNEVTLGQDGKVGAVQTIQSLVVQDMLFSG